MQDDFLQNRVSKYLVPLERFRRCMEYDLGPRFECRCRWDPIGMIGVYDTDVANGACLVVSEKGIGVFRSWMCDVFAAYASIAEVRSQATKEDAVGVVCVMNGGTQVFIPVLGSRRPSIDSFSFATFLKGITRAAAADGGGGADVVQSRSPEH